MPQTLRFNIIGEMPKHLLAKDLILQIIGEIGARFPSIALMLCSGQLWSVHAHAWHAALAIGLSPRSKHAAVHLQCTAHMLYKVACTQASVAC